MDFWDAEARKPFFTDNVSVGISAAALLGLLVGGGGDWGYNGHLLVAPSGKRTWTPSSFINWKKKCIKRLKRNVNHHVAILCCFYYIDDTTGQPTNVCGFVY